MARIDIRHLVPQPNGAYYYQATPAMRAAGMASEALGKDLTAAIQRAGALNDQWDEIRKALKEGKKAEAEGNAPRPGTLDWLTQKMRDPEDPEWAEKGERTIEEIDRALGFLQPIFGAASMNAVTPDQAIRFYGKLLLKEGRHKAALVMKWWRYYYNYGLRRHPRIVTHNPTLAVRVKKPKPRMVHWQPAQVRAAILGAWRRRWYGVAVAVALAYDTGLRPQDLRALTPRGLGTDRVTLTPKKTDHLEGRDEPRDFPIWPETVRLIERYKRRFGAILPADMPLLRSVSGRPFNSRHHLAKQLRIVLRAAGIPDAVQLRDLRRTGNIEAVAGGATGPQLAARLDHAIERGEQILDTYAPPSFEAAKAAQDARRKARSD